MSLQINPARILIIKPSAIGDVVHTLPVLNLLRRKWPSAKISWLITPVCAGIIQNHPQLDDIILFDRKRLGGAWKKPAVFGELRTFTRDLRSREFDLVLDVQGLFRSGWLAMQTGAPYRIGFSNAREGATLFYTHKVPIHTADQHAVSRYLQMARFIGCDAGPVEYIFPVSAADHAHIDSLLPLQSQYAVLLPGTNWQTKRWPASHFAALVGPLREQFGLQSVIAGGADTAELAAQIPGAINLTNKTTLMQLAALLARAALVIANDSGPMHIASALNRPLVTIFGPTNPTRTGPHDRLDSVVKLDMPCAPCYSRRCSHMSCMNWLGIDAVLELAKKQLNQRS